MLTVPKILNVRAKKRLNNVRSSQYKSTRTCSILGMISNTSRYAPLGWKFNLELDFNRLLIIVTMLKYWKQWKQIKKIFPTEMAKSWRIFTPSMWKTIVMKLMQLQTISKMVKESVIYAIEPQYVTVNIPKT